MITNLGTLAGDCASSGYDINSNGQIVGASLACSSAFVSHPFVWEDGQMTRLHILVPPGSKLVSAEPSSINDRGEIAGFSVLDNGALRAWLLLPCDRDHSDSEGCEAEDNGRFADAQNSVPVTRPADVKGRLTPEVLSALRTRMARRYHLPGVGATRN
jgi:probable HAF family extracellular repeat protein